MILIHASLLKNLDLQHRASLIDLPYMLDRSSSMLTGSTCWAASRPPACIEIRWRWAELRDAIILLEPHLIETNLSLLGPTGLEEPRLRTLMHIVDYVETLPWRAPVRRLLIASRH